MKAKPIYQSVLSDCPQRKIHDLYSKCVLQIPREVVCLFKKLLPKVLSRACRWRTLRLESNECVDRLGHSHFTDIVYAVEMVLAGGQGARLYLHVECQTNEDKALAERVLHYQCSIKYRHRCSKKTPAFVYSLVLYAGKRSYKNSLGLIASHGRLEWIAKLCLQTEEVTPCRLLSLVDLSDAELQAFSGGLPFYFRILQYGVERDLVKMLNVACELIDAVVEKTRKIKMSVEIWKNVRDYIGRAGRYLEGDPEVGEAILRFNKKVQQLGFKEDKTMTLYSHWKQKGLQEGLQEGLAKGLAEGVAQGVDQAYEEMARGLIKDGEDDIRIARLTKRTPAAVRRLRKQMAQEEEEAKRKRSSRKVAKGESRCRK